MLAVSPYFPSFVEFRAFLLIIVAISFFQKLFPIVPDLRHPLPKERQGNAKIPKKNLASLFIGKTRGTLSFKKSYSNKWKPPHELSSVLHSKNPWLAQVIESNKYPIPFDNHIIAHELEALFIYDNLISLTENDSNAMSERTINQLPDTSRFLIKTQFSS